MWSFYILLVFNTLNLGTIYTYLEYYREGAPVPVNPVVFVVLSIPIVVLTKSPRGRVSYFRFAWLFWLAFTIGGFLGPEHITFREPYRLAQNILKIWISIIGIPWLASRIIDASRLATYAKVTTVLIGIGAICAIIQVLDPRVLAEIARAEGRGAGLWIDPNLGAAMCACGVLFSLMFPFQWVVANVGIRILLLAGLGATLSRAGILAGLLALLVYGVLLKRWTAVIAACLFTVMAAVVGYVALEPLKQSNIPGLADRAEGIQQMLTGGIRGQTVHGRWSLWRRGLDYAAPHWLRGRGHGSMNYALKLGYLEDKGRWHMAGPHNYYIFVLGNSGIAALIALAIFFAHMTWIGLQSKVTRIRAGLIALVIVFVLLGCSDHSLFAFQFFGAIFAVFALAAHYARKREREHAAIMPRAAAGLATTYG
jgi:O-antigen ligase